MVVLSHIYIYVYIKLESGFFRDPPLRGGPSLTSPGASSAPPPVPPPKPPKNPKKPHFYPPPKKWVPTPKNSPEGRPPNPILGGGGGVNQSLIRGGFWTPPGPEKNPDSIKLVFLL